MLTAGIAAQIIVKAEQNRQTIDVAELARAQTSQTSLLVIPPPSMNLTEACVSHVSCLQPPINRRGNFPPGRIQALLHPL